MTDDNALNRVQKIRRLFRTGLDNIAAWKNLIPNIVQANENLEWVEESLSNTPIMIVDLNKYETLIDYLDKTEQAASVLGMIPSPPVYLGQVFISSGSAITSVYSGIVEELPTRYAGQPYVVDWANETLQIWENQQSMQKRSEIANERLRLFDPFLAELHRKTTEAAFSAQAGTQSPIEAAATLNRLLEQFKGALISRCRSGKGTTYQRISDNLAANSALTKTVVADGQDTYDKLNDELVNIRKHITITNITRMVELLHKFEEHVIVITDALDPDAVGIKFVS